MRPKLTEIIFASPCVCALHMRTHAHAHTHEAHAHMPRIELLPRIMHICGTLDCDGYISPHRIGWCMEEANTNPIQPDDEQAIFTAETQHCETGETGILVMLVPTEISPDNFGDWFQDIVNETRQLPTRFVITVGGQVVMQGGVEQ